MSPHRRSHQRLQAAAAHRIADSRSVLVTPVSVPQYDMAAHQLQVRKADNGDEPSVIYVTASKTFSGSASYITLSDVSTTQKQSSKQTTSDTPSTTKTTSSAKTTPTQSTSSKESSSSSDKSSKTSESTTSDSSSTSLSSTISSSLTTSSASSETTNSLSSLISSSVTGTPTSMVSSSPTSSPTDAAASTGMTVGAKAGIGIAIVAAASVLLSILVWLHKKNQQRRDISRSTELANDAKTAENKFGGAGAAAFAGTGARSPNSEKGTQSQSQQSPFSPPVSGWGPPVGAALRPSTDRPTTSASNRPDNPFGNYAERPDNGGTPTTPMLPPMGRPAANVPANLPPFVPVAMIGSNVADSALINPADIDTSGVSLLPNPYASREQLGHPAAITSFAPIANAVSEMPADVPAPAPMVATGEQEVAPVYLVKMDFHPSMPDELPISLGQPVRLVREYDDGWALCELLGPGPDNRQGVVPRTCLSEQPIQRQPVNRGPQRGNEYELESGPVTSRVVPSNGSPPRPPRPDEQPVAYISSPPLNAQSPPPSLMPQLPTQLSPGTHITFPQPPSLSPSMRAISPASFTVSTQNSRPSSPRTNEQAPTLPPLQLDMDMIDDGLLGSTSISLNEDPVKPTAYPVTGHYVPPVPESLRPGDDPTGIATSSPNALPPPPLFSQHPRSMSPSGANKSQGTSHGPPSMSTSSGMS